MSALLYKLYIKFKSKLPPIIA